MNQSAELEDAPLYVRWEPDGLDFAIEIRLDVIGDMERSVQAAQDSGVEVGGVFLGRSPQRNLPVLRIDEMSPIPRHPEDGPIFMLDPREHDRFLTTRWDAKSSGLQAVGFFRTHLRPGPLRLSLADRMLVTGHFTKEAMAVLLIQAKLPHQAALYAGAGTRLPSEPSIPEFTLDVRAFASLPEEAARSGTVKRSSGRSFLFWMASLFVLLAAAILFYRSWTDRMQVFPAPAGNVPGLRVAGGPLVTISWNHSASSIRNASSGSLTIVDGSVKRDLALGPDALRLGTVEYQPVTGSVKVTFTLTMPDATSVTQKTEWNGMGSGG